MTRGEEKPFTSRKAAFFGAGWLLVALFAGETHLLATLPGPAPQAALWGITAAMLLALWTVRSVRSWAMELPVKALIAVHLLRFVGIYFLHLNTRGELPAAFAIPAGWGDIAAAAGAAVLLMIPRLQGKRWLVAAWNTLALADILLVVTSGARMADGDRLILMERLTELPLSFLPLMVVPMIITTHVLIFTRIWKQTPEPRKLQEQPVHNTLVELPPHMDSNKISQ